MPKRKKNVHVELPNTTEHVLIVYADVGLAKDLEEIEGVLEVTNYSSDPKHSTEYHVWFDPRYDKQEVIAEIEALNKDSDIPDEFK